MPPDGRDGIEALADAPPSGGREKPLPPIDQFLPSHPKRQASVAHGQAGIDEELVHVVPVAVDEEEPLVPPAHVGVDALHEQTRVPPHPGIEVQGGPVQQKRVVRGWAVLQKLVPFGLVPKPHLPAEPEPQVRPQADVLDRIEKVRRPRVEGIQETEVFFVPEVEIPGTPRPVLPGHAFPERKPPEEAYEQKNRTGCLHRQPPEVAGAVVCARVGASDGKRGHTFFSGDDRRSGGEVAQ